MAASRWATAAPAPSPRWWPPRHCPAKLGLASCGLSAAAEGFAALTGALRGNKALTSLDVSYNTLGPELGKLLALSLYDNANLKELDAGHNKLGEHVGQGLAALLCTNRSLELLALAGNELTSATGAVFATALREKNTTLSRLRLGSNLLSVEAVKRVLRAVVGRPGMREVSLGGNMASDDVLFQLLDAVIAHTPDLRDVGTWEFPRGLRQFVIAALEESRSAHIARRAVLQAVLAERLQEAGAALPGVVQPAGEYLVELDEDELLPDAGDYLRNPRGAEVPYGRFSYEQDEDGGFDEHY